VYKLKRVNELSAHQFQLDIEELKNVLTNLPGSSSSPSYVSYVAQNMLRIENRIKVLGYPDDAIKEGYTNLVDEKNRSEQELNILLTLRGVIKPQSDFQRHMTNFINSL